MKEKDLDDQQFEERLKKIQKNHPDCVPILFMKHPEAPNYIKAPSTPFILFKKDMKMEQPMYALYNQIQQKGLYFFAPYLSKEKVKYSFLQPNDTVGAVFKKFGKGRFLTMVYSDKQLGMQGILTMQKWMIRFLVFLGLIWIFLYGYSYYQHSGQTNTSSQL